MQEKCSVDITSPTLFSTTAVTTDQHKSRQQASGLGKKNLVAHYNVQADMDEIRSVIPENVQQYWETGF